MIDFWHGISFYLFGLSNTPHPHLLTFFAIPLPPPLLLDQIIPQKRTMKKIEFGIEHVTLVLPDYIKITL